MEYQVLYPIPEFLLQISIYFDHHLKLKKKKDQFPSFKGKTFFMLG